MCTPVSQAYIYLASCELISVFMLQIMMNRLLQQPTFLPFFLLLIILTSPPATKSEFLMNACGRWFLDISLILHQQNEIIRNQWILIIQGLLEPVILIHICLCTQRICLILLVSFCQSAPIIGKIVLRECTFCQIFNALLPRASSLCQHGLWGPEITSLHKQHCHNTFTGVGTL